MSWSHHALLKRSPQPPGVSRLLEKTIWLASGGRSGSPSSSGRLVSAAGPGPPALATRMLAAWARIVHEAGWVSAVKTTFVPFGDQRARDPRFIVVPKVIGMSRKSVPLALIVLNGPGKSPRTRRPFWPVKAACAEPASHSVATTASSAARVTRDDMGAMVRQRTALAHEHSCHGCCKNVQESPKETGREA